jgi:hypothetical protein
MLVNVLFKNGCGFFRRILREVSVGEQDQRCYGQGMRDALRPTQESAQGVDRGIRMASLCFHTPA